MVFADLTLSCKANETTVPRIAARSRKITELRNGTFRRQGG